MKIDKKTHDARIRDTQARLKTALFAIRKVIGSTAGQTTLDRYIDLVSPGLADGLGETRMPTSPGNKGFLIESRMSVLAQTVSNTLATFYRHALKGMTSPELYDSLDAQVCIIEAIADRGLGTYAVVQMKAPFYQLIHIDEFRAMKREAQKKEQEKANEQAVAPAQSVDPVQRPESDGDQPQAEWGGEIDDGGDSGEVSESAGTVSGLDDETIGGDLDVV